MVKFARKRANLQEKDNPERKRAGPAVVAPSDCGGPGSRRGRTDLERGVCDYRTMANGGMMETDLSGDPGMKGKTNMVRSTVANQRRKARQQVRQQQHYDKRQYDGSQKEES